MMRSIILKHAVKLRKFRNAFEPIFLPPSVGQEVNCLEEQVCKADQEEPWSYTGENGPSYWGKNYPDCNGKYQSPIDIKVSDAIQVTFPKPLEFSNYKAPISSSVLMNTGHTVQLTPTDAVKRSIEDGGLAYKYNFTQFHFHWESEHLINSRRYPLEMHLVHSCSQGYAVVAVLFKKCLVDNPALSPILKHVDYIKYRGSQIDMTEILCLKCLLPENTHDYFRYMGSLTTPGCTEGVMWTVFKYPACISNRQLKKFLSLYSTPEEEPEPCDMVHNYRPVQPLNHRIVTRNVKHYHRRRL